MVSTTRHTSSLCAIRGQEHAVQMLSQQCRLRLRGNITRAVF